jgi:SAM-dependent methyltransferase
MRKGRIDAIEDLATMDLVAFNGGVNPWGNPFITAGFRPGAPYHRAMVEKWGFIGFRSVVDVGSGYGRWSAFLGEVNDQVRGYERNAGAVELSKKLAGYFDLPNVSFEVADVTKLPAEDGSFDAAWCNNGLHLFPRAQFLAEIRRVLKPGGLLFLGQYIGLGTALTNFFQGYEKGGLGDHLTKYGLGAMKEAESIETNGFTYCSPEGIGRVLEAFGFELSRDHPMDLQMRPGQSSQAANAFDEEMKDIAGFAKRIEEDDVFRGEFARHPEIAHRYPVNVNLLAIRR